MSYWEIFTWLTVIMLGIGSLVVFMFFVKDIRSILVFILFVKDIKRILEKFQKE